MMHSYKLIVCFLLQDPTDGRVCPSAKGIMVQGHTASDLLYVLQELP